jgi:hypothetical protein
MNDQSSVPRKRTGTDPPRSRRHRLRRLRRKAARVIFWPLLITLLAVVIWYALKTMSAPPPLP